MMRHLILALAVSCIFCVAGARASAADAEIVRVGVLKFGTVNWEIDTIVENGFDKKHGFSLEPVVLAGSDAGRIGINAGEVDVIVSDWLFVSRQRAEGIPLTFVPYSTSVGAIMVPDDSIAKTLADLRGSRVGVAGGPLDKNWLMFRALAQDRYGFDLAEETQPAFAAPPFLAEKLRDGELAAASNFWHYNARLETEGYRELVSGQDAAKAFGATGPISAIGYVFNEEWAAEHKDAMLGFVAASHEAKELLGTSDAAWDRLRPSMNAEDDAIFRNLVRRYREGIPSRPMAEEEADTEKIYRRLAAIGGEKLVGSAQTLSPGTFWSVLKEGE
ncbi:NitT/TauT family transport system substrate-binding protein [Rhodopseudomonas julia]|uniref:NitT/TauT family transport system substrate-binding protein n=1 Tax=Rhodopseudomonas julia TaxID=200617 RepID=A0ABU0CCB3_9BRAD|nr:ABC transporter substrate-binding protein [Rhodopseudomonas julia]MDQ0327594.1 NitT/TauT family transport system substrate-binding protein [Rhodopseudomonas julia]